MKIRALFKTERKYTYTQSVQLQGQTGCIGHLRGDFCFSFTSWEDHVQYLKTDDFKAELDDIIKLLRSYEERLYSTKKYLFQCPGIFSKGNKYGLRVDTEKYAYLIRCTGDYGFYCYCYVKDSLDRHIKNAKKGIRFIDSSYSELFRVADGEEIVITYPTGENCTCICRYIDEYHTEIGNTLFHICEFAERMEKINATYVPSWKRLKSIFSIYMYDEREWFENTSGLDAAGLCAAYAACELPYVEMARYGKRIEAFDWASIQQSDILSFSVEFDAEHHEIIISDGENFEHNDMDETLAKFLPEKVSCNT